MAKGAVSVQKKSVANSLNWGSWATLKFHGGVTFAIFFLRYPNFCWAHLVYVLLGQRTPEEVKTSEKKTH